jgi:hypothetical protein
MVLAPNDLFSWNNKYSKYTNIYIVNTFTFIFLAMHINSLCACWHPEAMKGLSSMSSRRLLISPRITSSLFPCPDSTDAPCSRLEDPVPPLPKWRPHSQGPRTLPHRDPEQYICIDVSSKIISQYVYTTVYLYQQYILTILGVTYQRNEVTDIQQLY